MLVFPHSASQSVIHAWGTQQLALLTESKLSIVGQLLAAQSLALFGVDPSSILRAAIVFEDKNVLLDLQEITTLLERIDLMIFKASYMDHAEIHHSIHHVQGRALLQPQGSGNFYSIAMNSGVPQENCSLIDCIHRALKAQGKSPRWTTEKNVALSHFGMMMDALVVSIREND
jgi:hypothetical protein